MSDKNESFMISLLRDDSDIGQYTNEILEAYYDDIAVYKQKLQAVEEENKILMEALTVSTGFIDGMAIITKSKDVEMILKQCRQALEKVGGGE